MNMSFQLDYDISFRDINGEERYIDNITVQAPVSAGDAVWTDYGILNVVRVDHFLSGQRSTINAKIQGE